VEQGEIHSLLGENGAAKPRLMKVRSGCTIPRKALCPLTGKDGDYIAQDGL
jgi:ABC-type uncharacterized transport system ATPase subunit